MSNNYIIMTSYVIYVRKSTESEDRQVLSIEAQIKELTDYAAKNNLNVAQTYIEAKSAKKPGRPVFNAMVKDLRRKNATGILCWKLDRLTRNLLDAALISELLESSVINEIHTPSQIYRNNSNDKFMTGLDWIMAKKYIDDLSENVRRGFRAKIAQGWFPNRPPLGYLNDPTGVKGEKAIVKDPERFVVVRKMWDMMLSGQHSVEEILKAANEKWGLRTRKCRRSGDKPLSRAGLYRIFIDPFYCGQFEFKGELFRGKHEPMVTPEEFDRVQVLLGRKDRPRRQIHSFAFTGMIRCGQCGAMITAEEKFKLIKKTGLKKRYVYYHCTHRKDRSCRQGSIEEKELKSQVDGFLQKITLPEEYLNWIFKYVDQVKETENSKTEAATKSASKEIQRIDVRLKNLLTLRISPENTAGGLLSDEEFLKEKNRLVQEKSRLESSLNAKADTAQNLSELTRSTFHFSAYARIWFAKSDPERQRAILAAVGSNHTIMDGKLLIQAKRYLQVIGKYHTPLQLQIARFEPRELSQLKAKPAALGDRFCILRGVVTDVRTEIRKMLTQINSNPHEADRQNQLLQLQCIKLPENVQGGKDVRSGNS